MPDNNEIQESFERRHVRSLGLTVDQIRMIYEAAISEVMLHVNRIKLDGKVFTLSKHPALKKAVDEVLRKMHASIYALVINSIEAAWNLSNLKNDALVDKRLKGKEPTARAKAVLYDPNIGGMEAFMARKVKGLNLSKRVWKSLQPFPVQLEAVIGMGIAEGKPAARMATEAKQYLEEPDKLFRRVRNSEGRLQLSKRAREYHPGQGVYRSSFKNALRLTRTETNIAYRTADFERWNTLPFVKGIEVRLSNRHPEYDICDHLKGRYPATFKFTGWHPQCLCHAISVLATDEEYSKIEDYVLGIRKTEPTLPKIEKPPAKFNAWLKDNADRIKGWSNTPYFIRDNPDFVKDILK